MKKLIIQHLAINFFAGCVAYNLGTGRGTSVLEMVAAFEKASGKVCSVRGSCVLLI